MGDLSIKKSTVARQQSMGELTQAPKSNAGKGATVGAGTKALFQNDTFEKSPVNKVQGGAQQKTFPPVPNEWKYPDGSYRTSERDMGGALERAFAEGGFEQGVAWMQEMSGIKVDGKFGKGTYEALKESPVLLQMLREQRLKETPGAKTRPLKPLALEVKEKFKAELAQVFDKNASDPVYGSVRGYEAAVSKLQETMIRSGEPMEIDGKIGKQTYESMVRLYGKATADELVQHLTGMRDAH